MLEILEEVRNRSSDIKINLATHGKSITPEMAKRLKDFSLSSVLISLDGHTPEIASQFRGLESCFDVSCTALDRLSSVGIPTRLGVVVWKHNYNDLEEFVKIGIKYNASNVFFNWLMPVGRATENTEIELNFNTIHTVRDSIKMLQEKYNKDISVGYHRFDLFDDSAEDCYAAKNILHIIPDGRVTPCSWLYKIDPSLISKSKIYEKDLSDIMQEDAFKFVENKLKERKNAGLGPCCLAACKAFSGGYDKNDPLYRK